MTTPIREARDSPDTMATGAASSNGHGVATTRTATARTREGYTDDRPIRTALFASNWELSAARAASVVHVMTGEGVAPGRLAVVGFGEHQPVAENITEAGRNANRRVLLVIMAAPDGPDAVPEGGPTLALLPEPEPATGDATPTTGVPTPATTGAVAPPSRPAARIAPPRDGQPAAQDGSIARSRTTPQPGAG